MAVVGVVAAEVVMEVAAGDQLVVVFDGWLFARLGDLIDYYPFIFTICLPEI